MGPVILFEHVLPHGLCVGVAMVEDPDAAGLCASEASHAASLHPMRRRAWIAGRQALRVALERVGVTAGALLPDDRGAPRLPPGVAGSISHKPGLAVAMASREPGWTLGVDIERREASRYDIGRRVLTDDERAELAVLAPDERAVAVILRFSLKEAIYKAIDPFVRRYVGFREVAVAPAGDGEAVVTHALEAPLVIEARWQMFGDYFLTSARARL